MKKEGIKISLKVFILMLLIIIVLAISLGVLIFTNYYENSKDNLETENINIPNKDNNSIIETENNKEEESEGVLNFDLSFLKIENQKENKVYSPLSIKYALKMLEEASNGESKSQISKVIGNYDLPVYKTNKNFALANSIFIKDTFQSQIKQDYTNILKSKYNADINIDSFESAKKINNWINKKTLEIIPEIISDEDVGELNYALINALAIDMEWEEKFIMGREENTQYLHEQRILDSNIDSKEFMNKIINVYDIDNVKSNTFKGNDSEITISGMEIYATINNYDIVAELGEENIKKTVAEEYRKFAKGEPYDTIHASGDFPLSEDVSDSGIEKALEDFLPTYISELDSNYHKSGCSTNFSLYTDEEVKIFAKDLKDYDGTTLQYIGIMPNKIELNKFIENLDNSKINNYIANLKEIRYQDFEEGVVTRIFGYIPKFKFEYDLNLMEDLKLQKITNVFDKEKADLSNMIKNDDAYINTALHSANIEFTQDGIKAAAATFLGGAGAGMPFDYQFEVPVKYIDLTFDKPYMFLIKDKGNGEVWFTGTVYEPLLWENEPEKDVSY